MMLARLAFGFRSAALIFNEARRAAVRSRRTSGFVIFVLAIGLAATGVMFSIIDAVILKPLPFERSHELVRVRGRSTGGSSGLSLDEFRALQTHVQGFESLGVVRFQRLLEFQIEEAVHRGDVAYATAGYVAALRLKPVAGRLWSPEEESRGESYIATIGYDLWREKLNRDPAILEKSVRVGKIPYRIIGVMPPEATRIDGTPIAVWIPSPQANHKAVSQGAGSLSPVGRIRRGVSLRELEAQVNAALAPYIAQRGAGDRDRSIAVGRFDADLIGKPEGWLVPTFVVVVSLLLITCLNAANVQLARSDKRASEAALRTTLGATRRQLALTALLESILLASAATAVALVLMFWGIGAIKPLLPPMFRSNSIAFNARVLIASIVAALATGAVCGMLPAWGALRNPGLALVNGTSFRTASRRRWQEFFLTCEIASVALVLTVSTLFVASFVRIVSKDLGFDRSKLLAVSTLTKYSGTVGDVMNRFATVPGVVGIAAVAGGMPPLVGDAYGGAHGAAQLQRSGAEPDAPATTADTYAVSANFFDVAGITFLRGRTWDADATADVAVIDEGTARLLFGRSDPIGQRVTIRQMRGEIFTVIGLIPRQFARGPEREQPAAYIPLSLNSRPAWVGFVLRTSPPPSSLVSDVERVSASIAPPDPSPGAGVHVVSDAFDDLTVRRRFNATLMLAFGIVATVIGAAGMYAVIHSIVSQQIREIAIRIAVGATPGAIRTAVLSRCVQSLVIGLTIGLLAGWGVSRFFTSMLFMVTGNEPALYGLVAGLLGAVGVAAAMIPAWHASRVDPTKVLQRA